MFSAKILKNSLNLATGVRLVTAELTYPRFIHAELMTHRMFSRNAASSRAIPIEKMLGRIESEPVIPQHWGKNQKGMQADFEIEQVDDAIKIWLDARDDAVKHAKRLNDLGIHKQIVNRLTEPFMWITVILSTTSFEHFRRLRVHPAAEPHFQLISKMFADAYDSSKPEKLNPGQWHLPLTGFEGDEQLNMDDLIKVSVARCARVSYLTHDGRRDVAADIELHDRLATSGHWSPFEHAARADHEKKYYGNFRSFFQYRKCFETEFVPDPLVVVG